MHDNDAAAYASGDFVDLFLFKHSVVDTKSDANAVAVGLGDPNVVACNRDMDADGDAAAVLAFEFSSVSGHWTTGQSLRVPRHVADGLHAPHHQELAAL